MGANATEKEEHNRLHKNGPREWQRDQKKVAGRDRDTERVIEWQRGTHRVTKSVRVIGRE